MAQTVIVADSPQGKSLQAAVESHLRASVGDGIPHEVLAQYIVVMLGHGNSREQVAENLVAFLGDKSSNNFTDW